MLSVDLRNVMSADIVVCQCSILSVAEPGNHSELYNTEFIKKRLFFHVKSIHIAIICILRKETLPKQSSPNVAICLRN